MSDFGNMQSRIATEIVRTNITARIRAAILSAIKHHEREQFYFNEARDLTFNTVNDQEYYSSSDAAAIATLGRIIRVTATLPTNVLETLDAMTWGEAEDAATGPTDKGQPAAYAYFQQQIRIRPIPDAVYAIRVAYLKRFPELDEDEDTNAWMTDAEELIRSRAKMLLFRDVIYSPERYQFAKEANADALQALRDETRNRFGGSALTPCGI